MKSNKKHVAVVTGASSGIGYATAKMLAKQNYVVYGLANNPFETNDFTFYVCDVTDEKQVETTLSKIFDAEKQLDVLINCAGMGISGSVENSPAGKIEKIFDVNFFGTVNMCKHAIPHMRNSGGGHIVNISSVAGELPIPFQTFYSATKSAIESFSGGLSMEVKPFGIKVCCVLPGDTKTGFTKARQKNEFDDQSYGNRINKSVGSMEKDEQGGMTPESVAKVICKMAKKKNPKPIVAVGTKYKFFLFIAKILPRKLVYKILYKMYAKWHSISK